MSKKTLQPQPPAKMEKKHMEKTGAFRERAKWKTVESQPMGPNTSRLRCRLLLGGPHGDNSIDPKRPVALCFHGIGAVVDLLGWVGGVWNL